MPAMRPTTSPDVVALLEKQHRPIGHQQVAIEVNIVPLSVDEDGLRGTRPVSLHDGCLGGIPNRSAHRGEHGQPQALAEVAIDEVKRQEPDDGNQGGDPVGVEPVERRLVPLPARNAARSDVDLRLNGPSERLFDEMQHGKEHEHDGEWPKKVEQAAAIEDGGQRGPAPPTAAQRKPITKSAKNP